MKRTTIFAAAMMTAALVCGQAPAQDATATTKPKHRVVHKKKAVVAGHHNRVVVVERRESAEERQMRELREKMEAQQAQIDALKTQVSASTTQLTTAQQSVADAQAQAATAAAAAAAAQTQLTTEQNQVTGLSSSVSDLKTSNQGLQETVVANQTRVQEEINSPVALHYKGVTITPVAFFAFEGVWRERSVNSDINTPFNSIPLPSAVEGHTSELNFSGRQSRLGALFEGNAGNYKLSGYAEMDFLGAGTTSNNNQSNSYVLRQRQIWGKGETKGGFAVIGGQMWSLVTEDGRGTDNRTEKLPNTIDPQYMVGYNWTRQPAIRFQQRFGDVKTGMFTMAMSLEQAQITNFTVSSSTSGAVPADYFFAGPGQNGGLYNAAAGAGNGNAASSSALTTYANNTAPDVLVKAAFDVPKAHFEVGGIARFLRDFYFPILNTTGSATAANVYTYGTNYLSNTKTGGGVFGSARVSMSKFVDVALQGMAGTGVGRYGSSQLADATLRPDETLEPIKNYHGLASLETHPSPKLDVYAYYGGEYAQRTLYTNSVGAVLGYGSRTLNDSGCYALPPAPTTAGTGGAINAPSTCASPTRYIQEGMLGFTYKLVNSPKYGRLQYQFTYSYLQRNLWSGANTAVVVTAPVPTPTGPRALDNMVHFGMRYYIP
jgi:hypothetical protein